MHSRAFVVAGAMKSELLADLRAAVDKAISQGTTIAGFRKDFDKTVEKNGWNYKGGRGWRTGVIFNTNLRTAYAAGHYKQMTDEDVLRERRFWRYVAVLDSRTRPEHAAWHDTVLPADDPWWDTHYPPNGWGCRCAVVSLSEAEIERDGLEKSKRPDGGTYEWTNPATGEVENIPKGIDPGWAYNPGETTWGRNEADWGVASDNYSVKGHALGDWLPQEVIDNADNPLQPEIDTNEFLNMLLDNQQEQRVANIVFNAASYPTGNKTTLSGTAQWSGSADDPIGDILTAVETCFIRANTLIFGADAWKIFRKLPEVLDAVKGATRQQAASGGLATTTEVANLLEVERVLVGRGRYLSSKEGQTATYARLWGKHCAALYVEPNPGIKSIIFGAVFSETIRQTQRDFDPKRGVKGAHYIKVAWNSDEKVIASDLGYMIENAVV